MDGEAAKGVLTTFALRYVPYFLYGVKSQDLKLMIPDPEQKSRIRNH
jgi:hypothetical protein